LQKFGKILTNFTSENESVSRFGGEEFMLLIPNQTKAQVHIRIEQLKDLIQHHNMGIQKNITASFGIAISYSKIDFKELINKADNALYVAKNSGRNCIKTNGEINESFI